MKELKKKLSECERLKNEYLAGWQKERANFLNYKKEEIEKIGELIKYTNEELILKILPLLDNLERLEKNLPEDFKKNDYFEGVLQIKKGFLKTLKDQGVEKIKALGEKFDPRLHEVVEETEKKDSDPQTVTEEIQKGYLLHGKVIRAAKVKIAK